MSGRTADLLKVIDHLSNNDLEARYLCLFWDEKDQKDCYNHCDNHRTDIPKIFRTATTVLTKDVNRVKVEDLIDVLRTFFCTMHDLKKKSPAIQSYREHFERLWEDASRELKHEVWEALRNSGRGIYPPPSPNRPTRPKNISFISEPRKMQGSNLKICRDDTTQSSISDSSTPSRPRSAQASFGRITESFLEDESATPPTPTRGPRHIPMKKDSGGGIQTPPQLEIFEKASEKPFDRPFDISLENAKFSFAFRPAGGKKIHT
jgi:hypothetical protein